MPKWAGKTFYILCHFRMSLYVMTRPSYHHPDEHKNASRENNKIIRSSRKTRRIYTYLFSCQNLIWLSLLYLYFQINILKCNMVRLDSYITPHSIEDDINDLANPELQSNHPRVNILVINLVVKYLLRYLGLWETRKGISQAIGRILWDRYPWDNVFKWLERIVQMIMEPLEDDLFGIECLADIRTTSALVKEIIFRENFEKRDDFFALDLGTGTGILLVAGIIAWIRSRAKRIWWLWVDLHSNIHHTEAVLQSLFPRERFHIRVFPIDITNPAFHHSLNSLRLSLYISETVSLLTPKVRSVNSAWAYEFSEENIGEIGDPFPTAFALTTRYVRWFTDKVRQWKIWMFPDIVNGLYLPDKDQSTIQLVTGNNTPTPLPDLGEAFTDFEPIKIPLKQFKRWPSPGSHL